MAGLFGVLTVVALLVFGIRVVREPRRVGNAVWLGIALLLAGLWLVAQAARADWLQHGLGITFALLLVVALVLPGALIANGVVMFRREGRSVGNLLSLAAGAGLAGLIVLVLVAAPVSSVWLTVLTTSLVLVTGYLVFVLVCLLLYSVLYGRFGRQRQVDAIVVLGCGLLGDRVPPLLAGRLNTALRLYRRQARPPLLVVSGGQGPGETVPEAVAMRDYLDRRAVPAEHVLLEDRASTTEENLRFSLDLLAERGRDRGVVAVTSNYHLFRTAVLARRLGLPLDVVGARTARYNLAERVPPRVRRPAHPLLAHEPRRVPAARPRPARGRAAVLASWAGGIGIACGPTRDPCFPTRPSPA